AYLDARSAADRISGSAAEAAHAALASLDSFAFDAALRATNSAANPVANSVASELGPWMATHRDETSIQCRLLRAVFGNPFRPVSLDPSWLTLNVVAIAQTIYDDRNFSDFPILGEALEDAGCQDEQILNHCRKPGEHVLGCWVLDLVLGKE